MADIELIIRISKKDYEDILNGETKASALNWSTFNAIKDGDVLPKGHGRLIDADEIQFENNEFDTYSDYSRAFDAIDQADTIIEADKESENKK